MSMFNMPHIIADASSKHQTEREVASGILNSGMLTDFQRTSIDGVIVSAMPKREDKGMTAVHKVKAGATKKDVGHVKFQGSKFA
jgi:hypothetical protein